MGWRGWTPVSRASWIVFLVVFLLWVSGGPVEAQNDDEGSNTSDVFVLTDENFDLHVQADEPWLVVFYAPWCGHCKHLTPTWEKAATHLDGIMKLGKVDATVHKGLASRFGIRAYPTIKFVNGDVTRDYRGGRSLEDIMGYARRMAGPAVSHVTKEEVKTLAAQNPVVFVLLTSEPKGRERSVYVDIAKHFQDTSIFLLSSDQELASDLSVTTTPAVVVLREDEVEQYPGDLTFEDLMTWVLNNRFPLFPEMNRATFSDITSSGKLTVVCVVNPKNEERTAIFLETGRAIAKRNRHRYTFSWLDGVMWEPFIKRFGMNASNLPKVLVLDSPHEQFFYDEEVDEEDEIETFLDEIEAGTRQASSQSAFARMKKEAMSFLKDAMTGKAGILGYAVMFGIVLLMGLSILVCFIPSGTKSKED